MKRTIKLKAIKKNYRVIGVDTFSGEVYLIGEYKGKEEALDIAKGKGGIMNITYVYDKKGEEISGGYGTF